MSETSETSMTARRTEKIEVRVTRETRELFTMLMHRYMSENPGAKAEDFIKYLLSIYSDMQDEEVRKCIKSCIESRRRIFIY